MLKRIVTFLFMFLMLFIHLYGQDSTENKNSKMIRSISEALQDIAGKNNAIPNIIYDGMTYKEVCKILLDSFSINPFIKYEKPYNEFHGRSYHGNYILYWSDFYESQNPTVLGYSKIGSDQVMHNILR